LLFAWVSLASLWGLGLWGWSLQPDRPGRWLFIASFAPALWAIAELAQGGDRGPAKRAILNWHRWLVAWLGLAGLCTVGLRLALVAGLMDPEWGPTLRRGWWLGFGMSMVACGNFLPKLVSPWRLEDEPFDWQRVHRFVGWAVCLGGIAVVLVWLFLRPEAAKTSSTAIVSLVGALSLGRKLISLASPPRYGRPVGDTREELGAGS
jgi:hypothetical protein